MISIGFRHCDDAADTERVARRMRQFTDHRAICFEPGQHLRERLRHGRLQQPVVILRADADHQAFYVECRFVQSGCIVFARYISRTGIARVITGQRRQQRRRIPDRLRQRSGVVHRPAERNHAALADPAIGRLKADHTAERGGNPNRTAGIGPQGKYRTARRHRSCRTTARTAGDPIQIPGIAAGAVMVVFVCRAVSELMQIVLADQNRAGCLQPVDGRRILRRGMLGQNRRTGGRTHSFGKI